MVLLARLGGAVAAVAAVTVGAIKALWLRAVRRPDALFARASILACGWAGCPTSVWLLTYALLTSLAMDSDVVGATAGTGATGTKERVIGVIGVAPAVATEAGGEEGVGLD